MHHDFSLPAPISSLAFDSLGQFLISAGDKNMYLFHNIVGYRAQIDELDKKKLTATTQAHKERLQKQIEEARLVILYCKTYSIYINLNEFSI